MHPPRLTFLRQNVFPGRSHNLSPERINEPAVSSVEVIAPSSRTRRFISLLLQPATKPWQDLETEATSLIWVRTSRILPAVSRSSLKPSTRTLQPANIRASTKI